MLADDAAVGTTFHMGRIIQNQIPRAAFSFPSNLQVDTPRSRARSNMSNKLQRRRGALPSFCRKQIHIGHIDYFGACILFLEDAFFELTTGALSTFESSKCRQQATTFSRSSRVTCFLSALVA